MPDLMRRAVGAAMVAALIGLLGAGPASAHAALVGSNPEDGATLATAPTEVSFTFNENVGNANLGLVAPDGTAAEVADVRAVDDEVTGTVSDVDQAGVYTLSYRVVSADGHPVQGTIRYTVEAGQAVEQQTPPEAEEQGFVHRHRTHIFWGVLAVAVAVGLLLMPLREREK